MEAKPQARLGPLLQQAREILGLSVRGAAARANISGTYLSQLEAGAVKEPSPHVLYNLGRVYDLSYAELMRAAGYVVPDADEQRGRPARASPFDLALNTRAPLTDDERDALAEYLAWYRSRYGRQRERG